MYPLFSPIDPYITFFFFPHLLIKDFKGYYNCRLSVKHEKEKNCLKKDI